ncbi:MAG: MCP four helix bundle domain-containing protein, partial [Rubrivivax sp.]
MKFRLSTVRHAFDHLPVARQLYAAFTVLLVLTAVLGAMALWGLQRVDRQAGELAGKWLVGVGHLADARILALDVRENEVKHSRTDDASYHAEYADKIKEAGTGLARHLDAYAALVPAGGDEATKLAALKKALAAYEQSQQRVLALGRDKKQQDAADISDGAASMAFDEMLGALAALSDYNFAGGKASAAQSDAVYRQARWTVAIVLAASLTLGLLLAWVITSGLRRQLGGEPST